VRVTITVAAADGADQHRRRLGTSCASCRWAAEGTRCARRRGGPVTCRGVARRAARRSRLAPDCGRRLPRAESSDQKSACLTRSVRRVFGLALARRRVWEGTCPAQAGERAARRRSPSQRLPSRRPPPASPPHRPPTPSHRPRDHRSGRRRALSGSPRAISAGVRHQRRGRRSPRRPSTWTSWRTPPPSHPSSWQRRPGCGH
jgi:hypothetical protein